jgi:hypothetical protein
VVLLALEQLNQHLADLVDQYLLEDLLDPEQLNQHLAVLEGQAVQYPPEDQVVLAQSNWRLGAQVDLPDLHLQVVQVVLLTQAMSL